MRSILAFIILFCAGAACAQSAAPKPTAVPDRYRVCDAAKVDADTGFDECQALFIQKIFSDGVPAQEAVQRITDRLVAFVKALQASQPGKHYESPSQQFPYGRMVADAAPAPPAPAAPKAPAAPSPSQVPNQAQPTAASTPAPPQNVPPAK